MSDSGGEERTLGQLVAAAMADLSTLVRGEIRLATVELKHSLVEAGKGAGMFGAAGFFGYVAFLLLSVAAALGIATAGINTALAFVIVGVVYLIVAAVLGLFGKRSVSRAGPPRRTIASAQAVKQIVARPTQDGARPAAPGTAGTSAGVATQPAAGTSDEVTRPVPTSR